MYRLNEMVELAVFDMDGVLVDVHSSWVLVHRHYGTDNEDSLQAFLRGEIDDLEFIRRDVERWSDARGDVPISEVEAVLDTASLFPGAVETIGSLGAHGVRTAIVSGGLHHLAMRIGSQLNVDVVRANDVEVDHRGYLTGRGVVDVPLRDKGSVVAEIQAGLGIGPDATAVVGDTVVDVTMFDRARVSVAFNPRDRTVADAASHVIRSKDLTAVLPLLLGEDL